MLFGYLIYPLERRITVNLFPWYLVRENAIPTNEFQSFRNETLIKIIRQYIAAEQKARQQKNICIPMLEKEYAASRDNRLLTLKRKLFNEKPIRAENIDVPFQLQKELQEYTGLMEEVSALKQAYERSLIQMGIENRQDLQRIFAEHNSILNPLPLLNRNFHHKLTKYLLESPSSHKAKTRKLDFQLSRILSRSTLKTSPFSSFTSVSLKKWGEETKTRKQYRTRINFYILQKIIDVLAREEGIRETVYFRMAPKKEREEAWIFTIQMDVNRGKIFNNVDKTIAVKKNTLLHVIDGLFQKRDAILYKDLAEALKPQAGKEGAETFLAALIKNNILFPNAAVDEFAEYPEESFQMQMAIFAQQNEKAQHVLELFHEISRLLLAYETENGLDRFQLNEKIGEKVAEAGSILGVVFQQDLVFYEDYVDDSIQGHQQLQHVIQREESTLHTIQKLSLLCNTTMELRSEFAHHFRLKYGSEKVSASQTDVYDLYMNIVRLFTKWTDVLAPVEGLKSPLAQKMEVYKAEVKRLFQQAKNDDIKSELDVGKINALYEDYQAHFRAKADSSTVMFQLEDGKMIVNKVYSGKLRLFLRFFHYYQELYEDPEFAAYINRTFPGNTLEIAEGFGFNANHHRSFIPNRLVLGNSRGYKEGDKAITLAELYFRYDEQDQLVYLYNERHEKIDSVDVIGSLVDYMLPYSIQILNMNNSPRFDIDYIHIWEEKEGALVADYIPRLQVNDVTISRRRWVLNTSLVKRDPVFSEQSFELIKQFSEQGLPTEFFVKKYVSENKPIDYAAIKRTELKPQYINIRSPIYLQNFIKMLDQTEFLLIEEVYPVIDGYEKNLEYQIEMAGE